MATSFAEAIFDGTVARQIGIERFKTSVIREIMVILAEVDRDIIDRLAKVEAVSSRRRLETLLREIRRINSRAFEEVLKRFGERVEDFASDEAAFVAKQLNEALPEGVGRAVSFVPPSDKILFVSAAADYNNRLVQGKTIADWLGALEDADAGRIEQAVRMGFVQGESIDNIVRRFRGTRALQFKDGQREITRRNLEALIRTSVQSAASQARDVVYQENAGLIKGVRWIATLDGRTSAICRSLDQKVFPVDSGPRPPAHFNCRSSTVPVLKTWKELGFDGKEPPAVTRPYIRSTKRWRDIPKSERPLINRGTAPGDIKYGEWLRRQPKDFVVDVLGPTKAELFLKGKLPMDKFVDSGTLREFNLAELRRREPDAFRRAGL